ncbi:hypothetical protein [Streptomyces sp. NRRL F-2747]|uniref:hypothetical protein n=1 Tax=Streptomyces sp. NRRL F-2747 TaxID=1463843 RepID=UPI00068B79EA|nr:hypothetical protein [Streptomyces sp. NRRL F-2747]
MEKVTAVPESPLVLDEYARRIRTDVDANLLRQEQLRGELRKLEEEHNVLLRLQETLATGAEAIASMRAETGEAGEAGELPKPRRAERQVPRRRGGKGRAGKGRLSGEASLIETVNALLQAQAEPRSVAEILGEVIAVRPATIQTVRNTLDRLVATSKAERTKQGRSVYYSAVGAAAGSQPTPAVDAQ